MQVSNPSRKSLSHQIIWLLVAKIIGFILSTAAPLLLVRALSQEVYGEFKQISLLIGTSAMILPMGLPMSAFYYLAREPQRAKQVALNISLWQFGVSLMLGLVLVLYPQSIQFLVGSETLSRHALEVALMMGLGIFSINLESIATANQDVTLSTIFIVVSNLSKTAFLVIAVLWSPTLQSVINAVILQGVCQTVLLLWYLQTRFPGLWTSFEWPFFVEHLHYALPLGASALLLILNREMHQFMVSSRFGATAYAIYAVGCFQLPLIGMMRDSIASILISRTSEYQKAGRITDIVELTAKGMRKISLVYWPVAFFLLVCAEPFIVVLFTDQYIESVPILRMNLLVLVSTIPVTDPVFRAFSQYRYYIVNVRAALLVLLLVSLYFSMNAYGMTGAIASVGIIMLLERAIICWKTVQILNIHGSQWALFKGTLTPAVAALLAAILTYFVQSALNGQKPIVVLCACSAVYGISYAAALWTLRLVEPDEIDMVKSTVTKFRSRLPF